MQNVCKSKVMLFAVFVMLVGCTSGKSDWEAAKRLDTIPAYQKFIVSHPKSKFAPEASRRVDDLEWIFAKSSDSGTELQNYLSAHPQGKHASEAQKLASDFIQLPFAVKLEGVLAGLMLSGRNPSNGRPEMQSAGRPPVGLVNEFALDGVPIPLARSVISDSMLQTRDFGSLICPLAPEQRAFRQGGALAIACRGTRVQRDQIRTYIGRNRQSK